jgi:hypothetical protein
MLFLEFFQWWYGAGWARAAKGALNLVKKVELSFSIPILLRTLFAPWKMIISPSGRSLDEKMRAALDNLVSRTVGFFVRIFSLIAAVVLISGAAIVGATIAFSWPLIPVLIVLAAFKGMF